MFMRRLQKNNTDWSWMVSLGVFGFIGYQLLKPEPALTQELPLIIPENLKYKPDFNKLVYGGNPRATNIKGSGKFNYFGITQAYPNFGFECRAASVVNIYKSLGLIAPNMDRASFEKEFTNIYMDPDNKNSVRKPAANKFFSIPYVYTMSMRGYKEEDFRQGQKVLTSDLYVHYANEIAKVSNYATVTGMQNKIFKKKTFKDYFDLETHLKEGWTAWLAVSDPAYRYGHYITGNALLKESNNLTKWINSDDSINGKDTTYLLSKVNVGKSWAIIV
jgi:hypothetical protein